MRGTVMNITNLDKFLDEIRVIYMKHKSTECFLSNQEICNLEIQR